MSAFSQLRCPRERRTAGNLERAASTIASRSKKERRIMSRTETTNRLPRNSHGPVLPTRLAHALSAIAQTLPNPWDESTDYFVPFSAEFDVSKPMNADSLRQVLDVGGH